MIKFLIQNKDIKYDFEFHLKQAIEYQNWYNNEKLYKIIYKEPKSIKGVIPVGSVEFVMNFIKIHYSIDVKPINIPEELRDQKYLLRNIEFKNKKDIILNEEKFVKSNDKYKVFTELISDTSYIPDGNYMISDVIDIYSEYRCFVYNGRLVGMKNYGGDYLLLPNMDIVNEMISKYKKCPKAYTLDVGINDKGTFLIEVHPFSSCGLYGFDDYRILPQMMREGFEYLKRSN